MTTTVSDPSALATTALLGVYARVGPTFVAGEGCELIAADGSRYLDCVAGIAVNALGYGHPAIRDAVTRALETGLIHVSNLYHTEPGERLAEELVARSFADRVFFCNSGAEANEAAFKFARKWSARPGIVAFSGSFHGRLFASLAATDRPDYRTPFEPLVPGVHLLPLGDRAAAQRMLAESPVGAVIIEPVQGEGGVRPVPADWLGFLRALCDAHGAALIFDEVQCGLGRSGTLFAYEQSGVVPDMLTLAKPLAGGLPMGAVLLSDRIAAALQPGDHATTFGGGPLVATVALGSLFLGLQAYEYGHAYHELNLTLSMGAYGATFFMLTGFHGFHVTIGTIMLIVILIRSIKGHFSADHHFGFEGVSWYWHFVDVVWLLLFVLVYWL